MSTAQTSTTIRKRKTKFIPTTETITCHICNKEIEKPAATEFDGKWLCPDCLCEETFICSDCEERVWNDENAGSEETPLCQSCYDEDYMRCDECGIVISTDNAYYLEEDDEYGYCGYCYDKLKDKQYIHNYSYKPLPIFYGDTSINRYFGVELEIDSGGKDNDNAHDLLRTANWDSEKIYIKTDGSLHDGMEIVTHPMTVDYHMHDMDWDSLTQKALYLGYKSHKTTTCGLHIHVNRNTFTSDNIRQEACIGRILFIVERFWQELLRFSRRTEEQIKQWAARYGFKNEPHEILDTAKKNSYNRYTCVNITNTATIEFRIFRGTLKYNTIIATLQLVDHICNMAISLCDTNIEKLSWCDFVEQIDSDKHPELITYMKERRLYVNEPIYMAEEE